MHYSLKCIKNFNPDPRTIINIKEYILPDCKQELADMERVEKMLLGTSLEGTFAEDIKNLQFDINQAEKRINKFLQEAA